jgi:cytochrome P450
VLARGAPEAGASVTSSTDWHRAWRLASPPTLAPDCFDPHTPVHYDEDSRAWVVYDYPHLRRLLRAEVGRVDVAEWAVPGNPSFAAPWAVDGPAWRDLRSLIELPYRSVRVNALGPDLAAAARRCLLRALEPATGTLELMRGFAQPLAVLAGALSMGAGEVEADVDRLVQWQLDTAAAQTAGTFTVPADGVDYFRALIAERTRTPRGGLLDDLIAAGDRGVPVGDHTLSEWEIVALLWTHVIDSADTLATQLGTTVLALIVHGLLDEVRRDRALVPDAVEAALWWNPAFPYVRRRLRHETRLGTVTIPAGADVIGWLSAANRSRRRAAHVSFGLAPRVCVGAALSRRTLAAGLNAVLDLLPAAVRLADEPRYHLILNNSLRELRLEIGEVTAA